MLLRPFYIKECAKEFNILSRYNILENAEYACKKVVTKKGLQNLVSMTDTYLIIKDNALISLFEFLLNKRDAVTFPTHTKNMAFTQVRTRYGQFIKFAIENNMFIVKNMETAERVIKAIDEVTKNRLHAKQELGLLYGYPKEAVQWFISQKSPIHAFYKELFEKNMIIDEHMWNASFIHPYIKRAVYESVKEELNTAYAYISLANKFLFLLKIKQLYLKSAA